MSETERLFPFWAYNPTSLRYIAAEMVGEPVGWLALVLSPIEVDVYAVADDGGEDFRPSQRVLRTSTLPLIEQRAREIAAAKRARERDA